MAHPRLLLLLALFAFACGDSAPADDDVEEGCECGCGDGEEYTPDRGTATIKGVVTFKGKAPGEMPLDMGTDKFCKGAHTANVFPERVLVGANGGLKNVFVRVTGGLEGWSFPEAKGEGVLAQTNCIYEPRVQGLRLGQTLRILNNDPIMHNIKATHVDSGRPLFNISQTSKGDESRKKFRFAGMVALECNVHGWMKAYVGVCDHPFYAVTGADGIFTIPGLPPGSYTLEAWHEHPKLGTKTAKVTVADGATGEVNFTFSIG